MTVRVKVCCISSIAEADAAVAAGADALGLVASMPSGPGVIADDLIATIARNVPPPVATFLLTSRTDGEAIADHAHAACVNTVQIVDAVAPSEYAVVRRRLPALRIVQVVHVVDDDAIGQAIAAAEHADAILLDSGRPNPPPGSSEPRTLGGTGRVHDWTVSRRIVESVRTPVLLAGGLNPDNVAEAVRLVRPFGVDVCSGVRTAGSLDRAKLAALVRAIKG